MHPRQQVASLDLRGAEQCCVLYKVISSILVKKSSHRNVVGFFFRKIDVQNGDDSAMMACCRHALRSGRSPQGVQPDCCARLNHRLTCVGTGPQNCFTNKQLFFYRLAPAPPCAFFDVLHPRYFQHRFGQKKFVENCLFAIRFLSVFLMFSMRVFLRFLVMCGLNPKMDSPQILHMCALVFEQRAVIVDCCCLVVM